MEKTSKIYIAGKEGLILNALIRNLKEKGYTNVITKTQKELDLLNFDAVASFFKTEKPEYVFMPPHKSGSIQANINYPAEFIYENLVAQNNIIHSAYLNKVKKLLFFTASCVYPKNSPQPIKEEYLLTGELEKTSEPYSIAKIAGIKMCQAYNKQYTTKFISIIPATLYGPEDDFDLEKSHVLSSLIRKFHEAKIKGEKEITLWGSGSPRREFIFIDDFVNACIFLMENDFDFDLLNIGTANDLSIKELAEIIKKITGFSGKIKWDFSKPDGAMRKLLDSSHIKSLGWGSRIGFEDGVKITYKWFVDNYNNLIQ
jgi:GDP-L-fucose synthase